MRVRVRVRVRVRASTESLRIAVYACTSSISSEVSMTLSVAEAS